MSNLVEIIWDDVPVALLKGFVSDLSDDGRTLESFSLDGTTEVNPLAWRAVVERIGVSGGDTCLSARLTYGLIGGMRIPHCGLHVVKASARIYIEVDFQMSADTSSLIKESRLSQLQSACLLLRDAYGARSCFAGLEPAIDKDTRLFSDELLGPLSL